MRNLGSHNFIKQFLFRKMSSTQSTQTTASHEQDKIKSHLPRVSIEYCTQCRW